MRSAYLVFMTFILPMNFSLASNYPKKSGKPDVIAVTQGPPWVLTSPTPMPSERPGAVEVPEGYEKSYPVFIPATEHGGGMTQ